MPIDVVDSPLFEIFILRVGIFLKDMLFNDFIELSTRING